MKGKKVVMHSAGVFFNWVFNFVGFASPLFLFGMLNQELSGKMGGVVLIFGGFEVLGLL